ncbi:MAG: hypothetical protein RIR11_4207 [Bacteroidota bacterium]|jgi:hypothetical protein
MRNFKNTLLLAVLALSVSFVACHDHDKDEDDTVAPVVNITSPTADASISGEVSIAGTVTDENSLHELTITITKDADGATLFTIPAKETDVHDLTTYTIAKTWAPTGITTETAVTLNAVAEDHGGNKTTKTVKFKVK